MKPSRARKEPEALQPLSVARSSVPAGSDSSSRTRKSSNLPVCTPTTAHAPDDEAEVRRRISLRNSFVATGTGGEHTAWRETKDPPHLSFASSQLRYSSLPPWTRSPTCRYEIRGGPHSPAHSQHASGMPA